MSELTAIEVARGRMDLSIYGFLTRGIRAAPHHRGIIDAVNPKQMNRGACVVCPPGSGKSTWISEIAPPWIIGRNPADLILHVHANDEKANSYLTTIQQVFEGNNTHQQIFPDVQPDKDRGWSSRGLYFKWRDLTGRWPIVDAEGWAHQGAKDPQYVSIGFNGGALGRRADTIILDDPFDPAEIHSPTFRSRFEQRFKLIIMSRLKPNGRIIFVCNRWHHADIVPVLAEMGFQMVTFPAILNDEQGQEQSYWQDLWPIDRLKTIRDDIGAMNFQCLYQGSPGGEDGSLINLNWFKYFHFDETARIIRILGDDHDEMISLRACRIFQAVDPAASTGSHADFFVVATVAMDNQGRMFVLDIVRRRLQGPDQPELVKQCYQQWNPYAIGVEKSGYQLTLVQYLMRMGLPIIELARASDKTSRHLTLAARYKAGNVYHRQRAPWLSDLEKELIEIPKSRHDDQADALADATWGLARQSLNIPIQHQGRMQIAGGRSFREGRW